MKQNDKFLESDCHCLCAARRKDLTKETPQTLAQVHEQARWDARPSTQLLQKLMCMSYNEFHHE